MSIPPLTTQYNTDAALKAGLMVNRIIDPKMMALFIPDHADPIRLAGAMTTVASKSAALAAQYLLEYGEACPEFIGKTTVIADLEIKKYTDIILRFEDKIKKLTDEINNAIVAIIDILISALLMIVTLTINLLAQLLHFMLIEIFWTMLSIALKAVWMAYAATLMTGVTCFWPSPATGVMVIMLAAVQVGIEVLYLAYLFAKIAQYIVMTVLAIIFVLLTFIPMVINLVNRILILSVQLFEQITGLAQTLICIPTITAAKAGAIAQFTSMTTLSFTQDKLLNLLLGAK